MNRLRFNPEINMGNLIVALTIVATSIGVFYKMDNRISLLQEQVKSFRDVQITQAADINEMKDKVNMLYYSQPARK